MRPGNDLFLLIQSLGKGEKRHFKLYAKRYETNSNYLRLFDAIEKQKEYDEQAIRKLFRGEKFAARLSVTKDYLYELILKSLRDYGHEDSPETEVLDLRRDIKTLLEKRLYKQAEKLIGRAKDIAARYELFHELLGIMNDEAYLPWNDRAAMFTDWRELLDKFDEMYRFGYFAERMRILAENKRMLRTPEEMAELDALEREYGMDIAEARSFSSRLRHYFGYSIYYRLKKNKHGEESNTAAIVELFHAYPQFIRTQTLAYLSELRLHCSILLFSGQLEPALEAMERLKQTEVPARFVPFKEILLFFIEQQYHKAMLNFEELAAMEERFEGICTRYSQELRSYGVNIEVQFLSNFAYAHFVLGNYDRALGMVNRLFAMPSLANYEYLENNARILYLILHFELGNFTLLEYLLRSSYRFFLKRARLHAFEKCFLSYLRRLSNVRGNEELRQWMEALRADMKELAADPREAVFMRQYDYLGWIESRLRGEKFTDTLQKRKAAGSGQSPDRIIARY